MHPSRITAIGAAGALTLGAFLPWVTVTVPLAGTLTRSGIQTGGDGWFFILLAAATLIAVLNTRPAATALLGTTATGLALYEIIHIQHRITTAQNGPQGNLVVAGIGNGLWLCLAAALTTLAAALWTLNTVTTSDTVPAEGAVQ